MTNHDDVPGFWQPRDAPDGCMFAFMLGAFVIACVAFIIATLALFR